MATAADVPERYDVVINGVGYMMSDMQNAAGFGGEKPEAEFGYSPTFVQRSNVQGDFGDAQQAFWLSATQRDWTLGEQQKFFHPNADADSARRYWVGSKIDVSVLGQVTLRPDVTTINFAQTVYGVCGKGSSLFVGGNTNLYEISAAGGVTDRGAHGLAGPPHLVADSNYVYMAGSGKIRTWSGAAFADFTASTAAYTDLAFLNNTLFACDVAKLYSFDTAGTRTTQFTWQDAKGGTASEYKVQLAPYGGRLLILRYGSNVTGAELWLYDLTGVQKIAQFSPNFTADYMVVLSSGMVLIIGEFSRGGISFSYKPAVLYYLNGTTGTLWAYETYGGAGQFLGLAAFGEGAVFYEPFAGSVLFYSPSTGGVSTMATLPSTLGNDVLGSGPVGWLTLSIGGTVGYFWPGTSTATSGYVISSLIDFDSSLDKLFRGIRVDFDAATDGNGGSVDIAYRLNDLNGAYTTLQTGATSGTEYLLSGVTGRSISVKITLNKGTSTNGPAVKRMAVRAVPRQQTFRRSTYYLQCTGRDGKSPLKLRDGVTEEVNDGLTLATNLLSAATSQSPVSITDEFGTYSGIVELDGFDLRRVRKNEFLVVAPCREV